MYMFIGDIQKGSSQTSSTAPTIPLYMPEPLNDKTSFNGYQSLIVSSTKLTLLKFMVHYNRCSPVYLSESIQPASSNPARQRLRSASSLDFNVPRTRTQFRDRAFSVAGRQFGTVCLSLLDQVRLLLVLSAI